MPAKTFLKLIACLILTVISNRIFAQLSRELKGQLFANDPKINSTRDLSRPLLFFHGPFRTYDGTSNNITTRQALEYGAANIALYRELPPAYGASDPNNAMGGVGRPSAREISNVLSDEPVTQFNERQLSALAYVWGQFLDHDISLTPTGTTESVPIPLPKDEVTFTEPIPFTRSEVRAGTGSTTPRQQSNLNTSWIDASLVYGSDSITARWLRTFSNGKMKTSSGNFLPWNTLSGEFSAAIDPNAPDMANDNGKTVKTFVAGDVRAAEHPGILSLHTIFVREHNRICDRLISQGVKGDELIYQMARKEVGALIQAITYQEFLPALGVKLDNYSGYRPSVRPDIMNTFATAGYRIGHTMVADDIFLFDNQCQEVEPGELDLIDAFWVPSLVQTYSPDIFLKGFATHRSYETDTKINEVLRNFLFVSPNSPDRFGIDLASLNIQRGRDHGLPDYNTVRKFFTGSAVSNFSQISSDPAQVAGLKSLYGNVNNIDIWVGALSEDHLPNASVGLTSHAILKRQFQNLRDGDFYFYLNDPYLPAFTKLAVLRTTLADVIKRNTKLTNLQSNVFFFFRCPGDSSELGNAHTPVLRADSLLVGANSEVSPGARIFPNPATTMVHVDFGDIVGPANLRIFNSTNTLVLSQMVNAGKSSGVDVNISTLPGGVYYINISNGKDSKTIKLLKVANL